MKITKILALTTILLSTQVFAEEMEYPKSARQQRQEGFGSVLGGEGGINLYNSENPNAGLLGGKNGGSAKLTINPYLWQASLNALSFMPLASVDSNSGIIVTDWYENPNSPGERYKVTAMVTSLELRVEALKITVFKQALRSGNWREVSVNPNVAMDLEEKILTKARELKIAKG